MLSFLSLFLASATPAASLPTPKPLPSSIQFQFQPQTFGATHPAVMTIVQILFMVLAVALVALMSVQTTKTEGLSGSIGGRAESAYHGRIGLDQQLTRLTNVVAIGFVVLAITYFFVTR